MFVATDHIIIIIIIVIIIIIITSKETGEENLLRHVWHAWAAIAALSRRWALFSATSCTPVDAEAEAMSRVRVEGSPCT